MNLSPGPGFFESRHRRLQVATLAGCLLALVVIMLGAWTRLVDAGLGCPDWPGCYGFLSVPTGEEQIQLAEARYPDSPVDASKGWPEMIHRYAAGTLGLVIFGIAIAAWMSRDEETPVRLPAFTAGFVVLQAAFGAWTVTLSLWPQVVAAHLLGGFTTLSLLFLLLLRLGRQYAPGRSLSAENRAALLRLRPWLYGGLVVVVLQVALGAWTAANYAAVACPDLPTCQGQWWPETNFPEGFNVFQSVGPNYLGGTLGNDARVAIHLSHRVGAIMVTVVLGALFLSFIKLTRGHRLSRAAWLGLGILLVQVALGILNVLLHIPVAIAVAHNAFGALLLLAVINLIYRVHQVSPPEQPTSVKP
ncbi:cytochrome c oxidase assembly protein subunit 15 [Halospina denitrificans]|uniref:Cytochrome c oxidase assembly protein subunit 15 n=1 Tax=Halospina denitrificans TaxID=332522 RepID=A0A4V3ER32_9GAMM|nr:COX15/CtaA family protein [Halospina denitrificans]TDT44108.1 cytochrome c oxidase assembly protein subunit 15 [Halospina denitrificans]